MSLDDETPTQYYGPNAVTFTGPHGKPIRVSKDHYLRLTEAGTLTDEQMLNAVVDGRSLADILHEANTGHRKGCSHPRNGRCICTYLAQWDTAEPSQPGRLGHKYTCFDAGTCLCGSTTDTICNHQGRGWHRDDNVTCQAWNTEVDTARSVDREIIRNGYGHSHDFRFSEAEFAKIEEPHPLPFPMEEKDYYPVIDQDIKALTVKGEIWEPRRLRLDEELRTKYWHGEYRDLHRRFGWLLGFALAGWALSLARGIWGF